ncbi:MAG TPA: GAF domain-containing sensor histidine kinase [Acidimicrobiales bacterium]|nr:GAF domain-containing sensor histidine kinase [Acidimicrobiales bacterium]
MHETADRIPSRLPVDSNGEATAYVRGMERLLQAVLDLASARTLDEIAEIVRHAARELSQADGATFVLRDSGYCYYMDEDAIAPLWRGHRFPMETCISGWAMLNNQGVAISDIYRDDRIPHDAYRPTFVKSLAISPIRTAEPIGAIGNYWATEHEATDTERRLLQALADSTAVALESVRLLTELEDRVAERTERLARANADLQQFAAIAAHDLRSPLATVVGWADLLEQELGGDDGLTRKAVTGIQTASRRLLGMIDELLTFARTGSTEVVIGPVDLDALASDVLVELRQMIDEVGATISVEPLGSAEADQMLLRQAMQNLIINAMSYGRDGEAPEVRVDVVRSDGQVTLRVADNGPGVPEAERIRVLEPFARGTTSHGRVGSGLGLAICRRVAEHHRGQIVIGDAPEGGAEFSLVLPAHSA